MAVKKLEEFKEIFASGDFTPDRMLEIAEDVADTFNDFSTRLTAAEEATAKKDKEWREKAVSLRANQRAVNPTNPQRSPHMG